jgi:hypothetical protein
MMTASAAPNEPHPVPVSDEPSADPFSDPSPEGGSVSSLPESGGGEVPMIEIDTRAGAESSWPSLATQVKEKLPAAAAGGAKASLIPGPVALRIRPRAKSGQTAWHAPMASAGATGGGVVGIPFSVFTLGSARAVTVRRPAPRKRPYRPRSR